MSPGTVLTFQNCQLKLPWRSLGALSKFVGLQLYWASEQYRLALHLPWSRPLKWSTVLLCSINKHTHWFKPTLDTILDEIAVSIVTVKLIFWFFFDKANKKLLAHLWREVCVWKVLTWTRLTCCCGCCCCDSGSYVEVRPDYESALLGVWGHSDLQKQQQWCCGLVRRHLDFY